MLYHYNNDKNFFKSISLIIFRKRLRLKMVLPMGTNIRTFYPNEIKEVTNPFKYLFKLSILEFLKISTVAPTLSGDPD